MLEATLQIYVACIIWDNIHEYYLPVTCSLVPLRRLLLHLAVGSSLEGHPPVYERWHSHLQHNSWLFETLDTYFFPARIESWILYDMWWRSTKIIARNESEFLIISLLSLQKKNPHIVVIDSHCEFSLLYIGTNVVAITLHGHSKEDWRFYQKGKYGRTCTHRSLIQSRKG